MLEKNYQHKYKKNTEHFRKQRSTRQTVRLKTKRKRKNNIVVDCQTIRYEMNSLNFSTVSDVALDINIKQTVRGRLKLET